MRQLKLPLQGTSRTFEDLHLAPRFTVRVSSDIIEAYGAWLIARAAEALDLAGEAEAARRVLGFRVRSSYALTGSTTACRFTEQAIDVSQGHVYETGDYAEMRTSVLHEIAHAAAGFSAGHSERWNLLHQAIGGAADADIGPCKAYPVVLEVPAATTALTVVEQTPPPLQDPERVRAMLRTVVTAATSQVLEKAQQVHLPASDTLHVTLDGDGERFILRYCRKDYEGKLKPYFAMGRLSELMSAIPDCRSGDTPGSYTVPATDISAVLLFLGVPPNQLICRAYDATDESEVSESALMMRMLVGEFVLQIWRATQAAEFKANKKTPKLPEEWTEVDGLPLSDYQRVAVMLSGGSRGYGLFMDRGTGKTVCVVQRLCEEAKAWKAKTGKMFRALIVGPNQVRDNWHGEVQRFATIAGKVIVIRGLQSERVTQLVRAVATEPDCDFSAVVIGYETFVSMEKQVSGIPWDLVVLDESHYVKSNATKRWQAIRKLRDKSRMRLILTGTPIGNSVMDLWSQLEFLGKGASGFNTFDAFKRFYGIYDVGAAGGEGRGVQRLVGTRNLPFLHERLSRMTFQITKEEADLRLPPKLYDVYGVEMTEKQKETYILLRDSLLIEIEGLQSQFEDPIVVQNILTKLLRLAQVTSGFVGHRVADVTRVVAVDDVNPKVEALKEIVSDPENDPLCKFVVWGVFKENMRVCLEAMESIRVGAAVYDGSTPDNQRNEIVRRYNSDPSLRVLICNPQTAAEGLNLLGYDWWEAEPKLKTYTGRMVFFSSNWSAILRDQAEDRGHRRGTRHPLQITDLVIAGTIDDVIRQRVLAKQQMRAEAMDVSDILKSLVNLSK